MPPAPAFGMAPKKAPKSQRIPPDALTFKFVRPQPAPSSEQLGEVAAAFVAAAPVDLTPFPLPALLCPREHDVQEQEDVAFYSARADLLLPSLPAASGAGQSRVHVTVLEAVLSVLTATLTVIVAAESLPTLVKEILGLVNRLTQEDAEHDAVRAEAMAAVQAAEELDRREPVEHDREADSVLPSPRTAEPTKFRDWGWGWAPSWTRQAEQPDDVRHISVVRRRGGVRTADLSSPRSLAPEEEPLSPTSPVGFKARIDSIPHSPHLQPPRERPGKPNLRTGTSSRTKTLMSPGTSNLDGSCVSPTRVASGLSTQRLPSPFSGASLAQSDVQSVTSLRNRHGSTPGLTSQRRQSSQRRIQRLPSGKRRNELDCALQSILCGFVSGLYEDEGRAEATRRGQAAADTEPSLQEWLPRHCKYWVLHPPSQLKEANDVPRELVAAARATEEGPSGGGRAGRADESDSTRPARARGLAQPPRGDGDYRRRTAPRQGSVQQTSQVCNKQESSRPGSTMGQTVLTSLPPLIPSAPPHRGLPGDPSSRSSARRAYASAPTGADGASVVGGPRSKKNAGATVVPDPMDDSSDEISSEEEATQGESPQEIAEERNRRAMERQLLSRRLLWGDVEDADDFFDAVEVARKARTYTRPRDPAESRRIAADRRLAAMRQRKEPPKKDAQPKPEEHRDPASPATPNSPPPPQQQSDTASPTSPTRETELEEFTVPGPADVLRLAAEHKGRLYDNALRRIRAGRVHQTPSTFTFGA